MMAHFAHQQQEIMQQLQTTIQQVHHQSQQQSSASRASNHPASFGQLPPALPNHIKLAKPNFYSGALNSNVDTWIFEIERYLLAYSIHDDLQRITFASSFFRELALQWWQSYCTTHLQAEQTLTWNQFKETMKQRFQPVAASRTARANIRYLRQGGKSVAEYCSLYYRQMQLINDMSEVDKMENFKYGLQPTILSEVDRGNPQSLEEAMSLAQRTELRLRALRQSSSSHYNYFSLGRDRYHPVQHSGVDKTTYHTNTTSSSTTTAPMELGNISSEETNKENMYNEAYERYLAGEDDFVEEIERQQEEVVDEDVEGEEEDQPDGHYLQGLSNPGRRGGNNQSRVPNLSREEFTRLMREHKCLRCKRPGHFARDCSQPQTVPYRRSFSSQENRSTKF
jgi:hypothetical protein